MEFTDNIGNDEPMENWKQFQGTALGGLMGQIYGNQNKPKINYPKPKTKKQEVMHPERFMGSGGKATATDPRKATKKPVHVAVPKNFKSANFQSSYKPIDVIDRRRSSEVIQAELDDIKMKQTYYRPAHVRPIGESEKDRLSQVFHYKGGKGLPQELTAPEGEAPFEMQARVKEEKRIAALMAKRNPGLAAARNKASNEAILSEVDQMKDQIKREIEERQDHLNEMKSMNMKVRNEREIHDDIARKFAELDMLNNNN